MESVPAVHRSSGKDADRTPLCVPYDPYFGRKDLTMIISRFLVKLFACPSYPPAISNPARPSIRLDFFIAFVLNRSRMVETVAFAALCLLNRLKERSPALPWSSGHGLFTSASMIAWKILSDVHYSNKSWGKITRGMFEIREINQMEREMCSHLSWHLNFDSIELQNFQDEVTRDLGNHGIIKLSSPLQKSTIEHVPQPPPVPLAVPSQVPSATSSSQLKRPRSLLSLSNDQLSRGSRHEITAPSPSATSASSITSHPAPLGAARARSSKAMHDAGVIRRSGRKRRALAAPACHGTYATVSRTIW